MTTLEAPMENPVNQLIRLAVAEVAANWKSFVPRFFRFLRQLTKRKRSNALYEILDYDVTLDLTDPTGAQAIFKRKQKVRFLQDHVIAYQDEAWGDGEVVAGYKCSPGAPVDMFRQGNRNLILISLRETKNRGDVLEFSIERTVKNGFTNEEEWLEVETRYPTKHLRVQIVFPSRPAMQTGEGDCAPWGSGKRTRRKVPGANS